MADSINIVVGRFYGDIDLADYKFLMAGLTADGWEVNQSMSTKRTGSDKITLTWKVSEDFTANSGKLNLELRAYNVVDGETKNILKYIMPPVYVRPTTNGKNGFVPDTAEQLLGSIVEATEQGLISLQEKMDDFSLDETNARLDKMENDTAIYLARPEVIALTKEEYDSTEHKNGSLYVIIREE
ncbi:MAG: hypothetical protein K2J08_06810 [Ruminococcus sp.]|nr:hypothetical protein [Ruminococcus sp.]